MITLCYFSDDNLMLLLRTILVTTVIVVSKHDNNYLYIDDVATTLHCLLNILQIKLLAAISK